MSRFWDRVAEIKSWAMIVVASLAAGAWTFATLSIPVPPPDYQTGQDCVARLSDSAPLSTPDREWLERCVSALGGTTPSPTVSPSTIPPTSSTVLPTTPPITTTQVPPTPPSATTTQAPPTPAFPTPTSTGVPVFWQPTSTRSTDLRVTVDGSVVQDVLLTNGADILVDAENVTIRRVMLQGGRIDLSPGSACNRTRIEQSTIRRPDGTVTDSDQEGRISPGGWTMDRVFMDRVPEGLRAGDKGTCGTNTISNSFIRVQAPDVCRDWHGDGIQGYNGGPVVVRNVTIDFQERSGCGGTAPFFYPRNQGNTSVDIDRLLVQGGGFSFRNGMPGTVRQLKIVNNEWGYGPIDVRCSVLSTWDAQIVTVNSNWQPTTVRNQPCNTETGS